MRCKRIEDFITSPLREEAGEGIDSPCVCVCVCVSVGHFPDEASDDEDLASSLMPFAQVRSSSANDCQVRGVVVQVCFGNRLPLRQEVLLADCSEECFLCWAGWSDTFDVLLLASQDGHAGHLAAVARYGNCSLAEVAVADGISRLFQTFPRIHHDGICSCVRLGIFVILGSVLGTSITSIAASQPEEDLLRFEFPLLMAVQDSHVECVAAILAVGASTR